MKATESNFLTFLKAPKQFIIPIYQRPYSWTLAQCEQLWKDIMRVAEDDSMSAHFVGSIVYIEKAVYQISGVPQLLVIDGQQRLTTLSLLLGALARALRERGVEGEISPRKVANYYLVNSEEEGELHHKLLLTQSDKETLIRLITEKEPPPNPSTRLIENSRFFDDKLADPALDVMRLYHGITKLMIVDIALNREHDNPQLIFESLNSTGLELTQADLIRNYVLMGQLPADQERLYNDYWFPMEQSFGQEHYAVYFDRFMRDYLTLKTRSIPNIKEVYAAFKTYVLTQPDASITEIVADIYKYSKYFVRMVLEREETKDLRHAFHSLNAIKVDVAFPFLLEVYDHYDSGIITRAQFLDVLRLLESYVFRRGVCNLPTNAFNKLFAVLAKDIEPDRYVESIQAQLLLRRESKIRFPSDEEFVRNLLVKDIYNFRLRNYLLRKLENHERKEPVVLEEYTIEHILPQNENLSAAWREALGSDWKQVQARHLHTLGNLTLTGYNAELSDRPFVEKRDRDGGFRDSPIRLNRGLAMLEEWNEEEIVKRGTQLASIASGIWSYPAISDEVLSTYRKPERGSGRKVYTFDDHPGLRGPIMELFQALRSRILALDPAIREDILKRYIAYKAETNFVDIIPQKARLVLILNIPFDEVDDPKQLCRDITDIGRWGNGDVEMGLYSIEQLDDAMHLIRQSYAHQVSVA